MDEAYLLAAVRYVELNPVRARITGDPVEYPWSSAGAHVRGRDDGFVEVKPLLELVDDWREFLSSGLTEDEYKDLRKHERTGRPLGSSKFLLKLEKKLGKILSPQKGGRPKKKRN
jgi:putative transposase